MYMYIYTYRHEYMPISDMHECIYIYIALDMHEDVFIIPLGPFPGPLLDPSLGPLLGPYLGPLLGPSLGPLLGSSLGLLLGPFLGPLLCFSLAALVGSLPWDLVGPFLWAFVGQFPCAIVECISSTVLWSLLVGPLGPCGPVPLWAP